MKTNMILRVFIVLSIAGIAFTACKKNKHYSFSESELEWIMINTDDPPRYLVNKTDTVSASISHWTQSDDYCYHETMPNHYDVFFEEGFYDFYIRDSINIGGAVRIYCYERFRVEIDIPGRNYDYVIPKDNIDTAFVNGVIYHGVHKYYLTTPDEDDAAYFCFVKGKGYIQIILNNGTLIELIGE